MIEAWKATGKTTHASAAGHEYCRGSGGDVLPDRGITEFTTGTDRDSRQQGGVDYEPTGSASCNNRRLLGNDAVRYALGALPTLPPCVLASVVVAAMLYERTPLPAYNLPLAIGLAVALATVLIFADYVSSVYAHAAGLRP